MRRISSCGSSSATQSDNGSGPTDIAESSLCLSTVKASGRSSPARLGSGLPLPKRLGLDLSRPSLPSPHGCSGASSNRSDSSTGRPRPRPRPTWCSIGGGCSVRASGAAHSMAKNDTHSFSDEFIIYNCRILGCRLSF